MTVAAWRLRQTLPWSTATHGVLFGLLFWWGATALAPEPPPPIDVVMLDTALIELPKGDSPIPGLGTTTEPVATPAPIDTPPPEVAPPIATLAPIAAPTEMAQPQVSPTPKPTPTRIATPTPKPTTAPVAARTPAPQRTSTPVRATAQTDKLRSLINSQSRPSTAASTGNTNSAGWELGTGATPVRSIPAGAVQARYRQAVTARVKGQWMRPSGASEAVAVVTVTISNSGSITGVRLAKSSGDSQKDDSAVRAARRANPLPAPPAEVKDRSFTISFKR